MDPTNRNGGNNVNFNVGGQGQGSGNGPLGGSQQGTGNGPANTNGPLGGSQQGNTPGGQSNGSPNLNQNSSNGGGINLGGNTANHSNTNVGGTFSGNGGQGGPTNGGNGGNSRPRNGNGRRNSNQMNRNRGNSQGLNIFSGAIFSGAFLSRFIDPNSALGRMLNLNRGSNTTNTNNQRGGNNSNNKLWIGGVIMTVLILFGVFYTEKIPFVFDKSLQENLNQYLVEVENTNQYPMGRGRTGNELYDREQILPSMIGEMGHDRYFIYIYTLDDGINKKFNDAVLEYQALDRHLHVYRVYAGDALADGMADLHEGSPKVIEMMRLEQSAIPISEYRNVDDWKKVWGR